MFNWGEVLLVGCDDSNHKGLKGHEIILATFSLFYGDGIYDNFRNRRNCRPRERARLYTRARRWMKDTVRDYRFAAIERERAIMDSNIPWVLPTLVNDYLNSCTYEVKNLKIYIDGHLKKTDKKSILEQLPEFENINVHSVVKGGSKLKGRKPRILHCPKILWGADIWANIKYKEGVYKNLRDPKRVIIP